MLQLGEGAIKYKCLSNKAKRILSMMMCRYLPHYSAKISRALWNHELILLNKLQLYSLVDMPPTVILIRHAQALHNVASDWSLHDPPLSKLGEEQCAELQEALKKDDLANKVELIVVSAMRRTLQTAKLSLGWLIEDKKVAVLPDAGWQGRYKKRPNFNTSISLSIQKNHFQASSILAFVVNFAEFFV